MGVATHLFNKGGGLSKTPCFVVLFWALLLWPAISPTDPDTPENSKTQKSDSKVASGLPAKVTKKLLKSDSKVTKTIEIITFESLLSNFWDSLAGSPKATFESLFCVFEFSGVSGSVGEMAGQGYGCQGPKAWKKIISRLKTSTSLKTLTSLNKESRKFPKRY